MDIIKKMMELMLKVSVRFILLAIPLLALFFAKQAEIPLQLIRQEAAKNSNCMSEECSLVYPDANDILFDIRNASVQLNHFVTTFTNRESGAPANKKAAVWLFNEFSSLKLTCAFDKWQDVNYSEVVELQNVICILPGESPEEIVIVAHLDQSPDTYQGADNDGSGIAILLELARVFASEVDFDSQNQSIDGENDELLRYTLVFLATDAEELGMVGSARYIESHPITTDIIAAISLDNVGKKWFDGLIMKPTGQYRNWGELWLQIIAQESAISVGLDPPQYISIRDQIVEQASPVSFMDQGPFVAAHVPALGFSGNTSGSKKEERYHRMTFHSVKDIIAFQAPNVLENSGKTVEALVRTLLSNNLTDQSRKSNPSLVFDPSCILRSFEDLSPLKVLACEANGQALISAPSTKVFDGWPMSALLAYYALFPFGFLLINFLVRRKKESAWKFGSLLQGWKDALPVFLRFWIPLLLSIILTYGFVKLGLMDEYAAYPATQRDAPLFEPRYLAVSLFLISLAWLLVKGKKLVEAKVGSPPDFDTQIIPSLSFLIIGFCAVYLWIINPMSLIFLIPIYMVWTLHYCLLPKPNSSKSTKMFVKIFNFLLAVIYLGLGLIIIIGGLYGFGWLILFNKFAVLWFVLMMFSIQMISFPTAAVITAILASGLTLVSYPASPKPYP